MTEETSSSPATPAAGWYPDPAGTAGRQRWWNGASWSDVTRADPAVGAASPFAVPQESSAADQVPPVPQSGAGWGGTHAPDASSPYATQPYPSGPPTTQDGVPLAGYGRRFVARMIDNVTVSLLALAVVFRQVRDAWSLYLDQIDVIASGGTVSKAVENQLVTAMSVWTGAALVIGAVYTIVFLMGRGATPGKLLLGIRVRPVGQERNPTFWEALRRWLAGDALALLLSPYLVVDGLFALADRKRQSLHDKAAGTVVVRSR